MMSTGRQHQPRDTLRKKHRQLSGYESSSPEDNGDDDEIDETFLALQKLLKALNNSTRQTSQVVPMGALASSRSGSLSGANGSTPQSIQEEMLELRRRERERFRHMLFSENTRTARVAHYQEREDDDDDDEEPVMSVESTISNRVISGSFSRLNVHVISRDRWSQEEVERLPIVLLPKNGKVVSPADNPKLHVCHTNEHNVLRDQLIARLRELPQDVLDDGPVLTPPQSTWYIQMRNMDAIHCE